MSNYTTTKTIYLQDLVIASEIGSYTYIYIRKDKSNYVLMEQYNGKLNHHKKMIREISKNTANIYGITNITIMKTDKYYH